MDEICQAAIAAGSDCHITTNIGPVDQIGGMFVAITFIAITLIITVGVVLGIWLNNRR